MTLALISTFHPRICSLLLAGRFPVLTCMVGGSEVCVMTVP